jgi:hypothetical protein
MQAVSQYTTDYPSVFVFNPAESGYWKNRNSIVSRSRDKAVAQLSAAKYIKGYVVIVEEDEYERPEDLAFLGKIPGLNPIQISAIDDIGCPESKSWEYHSAIWQHCYESEIGKVQDNIKGLFSRP